MKTIKIEIKMYTLILLIFFSLSCTDKVLEPKYINTINSLYLPSLNYTNNDNPLDSCGYYHNFMLDFHIVNTTSNEYDSALIKQEIYNTMGMLGDEGIFNTYRALNENRVDFYYSNVINMNYHQIISEYGANPYVVARTTLLYEIVNNYKDSVNYSITTLNRLLDEIKSWEDDVCYALNYYTYDSTNLAANQLLGTSSIFRYSIYYWLTVVEDSTNSWNRYLIIPSLANRFVVGKDNDYKLLETKSEEKLTWWDVLVIAGIDAIGYFAGAKITNDQGQQVNT